MKKLCFVFALCLSVSKMFGQGPNGGNTEIPLVVNWIDPSNTNTPIPKAPPRPLAITLNDNILTLPVTSVDYTLELRDENGTLVYSSYIPTGTTQIILPTTLSGNFEIRLVADTYYYIGYISM